MKINKKTIIIISLILVISLIVGLSYAYYSFSVSLRDANALNTACFELTFSEGNSIDIGNGIPVSDEDALDLEPFHFTIRNICNSVMDYNINIETLTSGVDAIDLNAVASKVDSGNKQILGNIENNSYIYNSGAVSSKTLLTGIITGGETKEHDVRLWIDESATVEQSANKSYLSKIVVVGSFKHDYIDGEKVLVTFDSRGGTNLSYSNREYAINSVYGYLPTATKDGYTLLGWDGSILPDEYQEVEYIKFDGNQYIDTNLIPSNHTTEIKFDFETYGTEALFGTSQGFGYYSFITYNNKYDIGLNGSEIYGSTCSSGDHTLIFNGDNNEVILDGDVLSSEREIKSINNLKLGQRGSASNLSGKIYYVKITNKDTNELERYMIPCYKKNDGVIGMYDLISNHFFTNDGSGTFGKGDDLYFEVTPSTMVISNENHTLHAVWGHNPTVTFDTKGGSLDNLQKTYDYDSNYTNLPTPTREDYTFLGWSMYDEVPDIYQGIEYIKFNVDQYIDTKLIPSNHKTEIKFDFETFATEALFGTSQGYGYYSFISHSNKYDIGLNGSEIYGGSWSTGDHTLIFNGDNNSIILDGDVLSSESEIKSTNNLILGKRGSSSNLSGKIYYVKITNKATNELERYFIPCYRKIDGVIGMYDLVSKKFYTNDGSGTFEKGDDLNFEVTSSTKVITNDNHTLYAMWEHNPTVTFDANGGSVSPSSKKYNYDSNYTDLPIPTRNGYNFKGWYSKLLPTEYQEVEYIKFNGDQYINTNLIPSNHKTEIKFDFEEYATEALFGTTQSLRYYSFISYRNQYYYGLGGYETFNGSWSAGTHTLIFNADNNAIILDNEELSSGVEITSSSNLVLGQRESASNLNGKIYYVKITNKATNEIERYLIPCYRKNDHEIGMYDLVSNQFFTNNGSGEFDRGNKCVTEKDYNYVNYVTSSNKVVTNNDHILYAMWEEE